MRRRHTLAAGAGLAALAAAPPARAAFDLEANKELARRFYAPFATGEVDLYDDILSETWIEHPPAAPGQARGGTATSPWCAACAR